MASTVVTEIDTIQQELRQMGVPDFYLYVATTITAGDIWIKLHQLLNQSGLPPIKYTQLEQEIVKATQAEGILELFYAPPGDLRLEPYLPRLNKLLVDAGISNDVIAAQYQFSFRDRWWKLKHLLDHWNRLRSRPGYGLIPGMKPAEIVSNIMQTITFNFQPSKINPKLGQHQGVIFGHGHIHYVATIPDSPPFILLGFWWIETRPQIQI